MVTSGRPTFRGGLIEDYLVQLDGHIAEGWETPPKGDVPLWAMSSRLGTSLLDVKERLDSVAKCLQCLLRDIIIAHGVSHKVQFAAAVKVEIATLSPLSLQDSTESFEFK